MNKRESMPPGPAQDGRLRADFFRSERDGILTTPPRLQLENKLNFQYKGDVFGQHGAYTEATLYMSRLPSSRKRSILRPKLGAVYKLQAKLAPMQQSLVLDDNTAAKPSKSGRKRQYALAMEAMASNPMLHTSLLNDNVIPTILSICRPKDSTTLASCVATLCHLSSDPLGREALLKNNALSLLGALSPGIAHDKRILQNFLAMLANLTIEDSFESVFVKEKALELIMAHRKSSEVAEEICTFAIFNLACPAYSYPRIDDVIRAINEHGRDAGDRESLSRALYNLSCTRINQVKLVEGESMGMLRSLLRGRDSDAMQLNALMAFWHLAENPHCRKAITRLDCIRALIDQLQRCASREVHLKCVLLTLVHLAPDLPARELLGKAEALDALSLLVTHFDSMPNVDPTIQPVVYRLIALILSAPPNVQSVNEAFFQFLLSYQHEEATTGDVPRTTLCSRYVLFSLACILSWHENDEVTALCVFQTGSVADTDAHVAYNDGTARIEQLLDDPRFAKRVYEHIETDTFALDSPEVYFQMLLLYNASFRYNKIDVALRAGRRLQALALASKNVHILALVCGTLFSLCQEYEVHAVLRQLGVLDVLAHLTRQCDEDAQAMCLEIVCIIFDGRKLARTELVQFMEQVAPALVQLCAQGSAAIRAGCAACFARFATIDECRHAMAQHGVVGSLAILANDDDTATLRLCVYAYSYLSRDAAICSQLIQSGIIKSLTFLAAAPEEAVRRACAMTLCNLSTAEENVAALVKSGALRALLVISCVKSNDPETRRICMKAVMNLLRVPATIPQMCQDGLLWAFGLFTSAMEPKDYDILCDAFCALAFYPVTRKGIVKPGILAAMLQVLSSPQATPFTKLKLLKGISNVLCDLPHAAQLIHVGVLQHLIAIIEEGACSDLGVAKSPHADADVKALVAQILVLIFQSCPDAESDFAQPDMLHAVGQLLQTEQEDCGRCCGMLLYQMSLHARTRPKILDEPTVFASLPQLFQKVSRETQLLLVRMIYNVSSDRDLLVRLSASSIVPCLVSVTMHKKSVVVPIAPETALLCAGLLRNLSCEPASHEALMREEATELLLRLFAVDSDYCKEDASVSLCNLFLGRINSNALLSRSVLPVVLWLCSHTSTESRVLGTTVVRKLALAPGNSAALVDGGVVSHLALLMQDCATLFVQKNCIATFCCIARMPGVPAVLASYGVIASVLELLQGECADDQLFEAMCVDLLTSLAAFARADDPRENKLSSILFHLIESDDRAPTTSPSAASSSSVSSSAWQCDRSFLQRNGASPLAPASLSVAHQRALGRPPSLRHTLYPIRFLGYAVDVTQMASHIDVRTIEPIVPALAALGELASTADAATAVYTARSTAGAPQSPTSSSCSSLPLPSSRRDFVSLAPPSRFEFAPLPMFPKLRMPFTATPSTANTGS